MPSIAVLADEIQTDELARGYAAMTDVEVAADMNTKYRILAATTLTSAQVYEATVSADFQGLSDAQKAYVRDIWGLGLVDVSPDSKARIVYITVFGSDSATIVAIQAMLEELISRGEEIGWGWVKVGHVELAKGVIGG